MHIVKISDSLGNQMFQYAFAKRMQLIYHKKVCLDTRYINNEDLIQRGQTSVYLDNNDRREYGLDHFKITLPVADNESCKRWRYCDEAKWLEKDHLMNQNRILPAYFRGYYFNLSYYDDIKKVLMREFMLKTPIKLPNELRYIMKNRNTVSVHIRKGDFVKLSQDISQRSYYPNAIYLMNEKVNNPVFLVFSDDIDWVKQNMEIAGDKLYISEMKFSDYEELTIMKHCSHNIIANSTFSYWAAYLNPNANKLVICPKNWKSDIIPLDWIKLNR